MTTPLGAALNSFARMADQFIEVSFPDKCSIERPTFTRTGYGTTAKDYYPIESSIGCSWGPAGKDAKEYVRAAKLTGVTAYMITMPAQADVRPQDRLIVEARGNESEHTFEVKGAPIRNAGLPLLVLCTLEES